MLPQQESHCIYTSQPATEVLYQLVSGSDVELTSVATALDQILNGDWTSAQVAAFAMALRIKGETAPVLAEAARALRRSMLAVRHDLGLVLDTCGTGGDGRNTLSISTGAALVVAACGVPVAKHGNRAASSRSGSADVIEELGIPLDVPADRQAEVLRHANIVFLFAPLHHAALRHAAQARRELGIRTLFNLIGPLANPAGATHQLLGTGDDAMRPVLARALKELGTCRAWVVRGEDGVDEVSASTQTRVSELTEGRVSTFTISPEDFGIERVAPEAMRGGSARENAAALAAILSGLPHPGRSAIVLNAAAGLVVAAGVEPREAARAADHALASGAAAATLTRWKRKLATLRAP